MPSRAFVGRWAASMLVLFLCFAARGEDVRPGATKASPVEKRTAARGPSLDERFLFQPAKFPAGPWDQRSATCQDIEFESADGTKLHAWLEQAAEPVGVVLYCHGNAGNLSLYGRWMELLAKKHKLTVMVFDYRGYGKSEGRPTAEGVVADAGAARAELARRTNTRAEDIIVWGRSLGGAVAVQLATQRSPRGLILESTFTSFREIAGVHQPTLAWLVPKTRLNSIEAITKVKCPLLQSHGTIDSVIPYAMGRRLHAAAGEPKTFIALEGRNHNDLGSETFDQELDRFCRSLKQPEPRSAEPPAR